MAAADVVLCAASTSLYHTTAKAAAQRAGARGDFNAPYRGDAWRAGAMTADFLAIRERAERLAALWRRSREIRITSPAGTDLRATVGGREPMAWLTGICRNPGEVSALPGGEVSLPPLEGTSEGVVVWERVASDLGALDGPVTITVRAGRAVGIVGGASAERLRAIVASVVDADNIGEIGIGLNPAARIGDEITEAKKAFGTVHIALGDFGQRIRRTGRVRRPPRRHGHGADHRVRRHRGRRRRSARLRRRAVSVEPASATEATDAPRIVTPYPGPRAQAVIDRMRAVEGAGPRTGGPGAPLVVEEASGSVIVDPDGNRFVDLGASFAATTIGHSHPAVVAAIRDQAGRAAHVSSAAISEARIGFEEALIGIAPTGLDRVLLSLTGSDANDTALKLARTATGRREVIAFSGGYFGRGSGVIGLAGKAAVRAAVGRDTDAHFLPYPYPYRWPLGPGEAAGTGALALVRHALEDPASGFGPIAAVLVEPVQGNGGVVIPPDGFLAGLRELCDRHGVVLVFDEIQSGFGRTGRTWAAEHWGIVPDLMTVGKGIGGGQAVSAVVGRAAVMSHWTPGSHTTTFMGNAVNLAAGLAAIGVLRDEGLPARSASLGADLLERLATALAGDDHVGEVRGLGLFVGIEIVTDRATRTPDAKRAAAIRRWAFERGVLLGGGGHHENVVKVCPPLTIDPKLLDTAVGLTIDAIEGAR